MRKIDPSRFRIATQGTSREINRRIALNLVRAHQPISRADLARAMGVHRGTASLIVNDLLRRKLIFEGATGEAVRGRKPTFLYVESRRRCVVAVDLRASQTYMMIADLLGNPIAGVVGFPIVRDPKTLVATLARRIKALLAEHPDLEGCEGLGVAVPGVVEQSTMRVLHAPTLGWRDVDLKEPLAAATGLPVHIENSGRACALAQLWTMRDELPASGDLVFVTVSDGLGGGVVVQGELLRGRHNIAGEFGHLTLALDGPRCSCGAVGCWEAYVSNRATLARYFGRAAEPVGSGTAGTAVVHHRGPDRAGAQRRRQSRRGDPGDGTVPRSRSRQRHQRAGSGAGVHRWRNHGRLGSDRADRQVGARGTCPDAGGRRRHDQSGECG